MCRLHSFQLDFSRSSIKSTGKDALSRELGNWDIAWTKAAIGDIGDSYHRAARDITDMALYSSASRVYCGNRGTYDISRGRGMTLRRIKWGCTLYTWQEFEL